MNINTYDILMLTAAKWCESLKWAKSVLDDSKKSDNTND